MRNRAFAPAKINLALVVGPARNDGKHEVATVLQRVDLADRVEIAPAPALEIAGFPGDTIVGDALRGLAAAAGVEPRWRATIEKRIPVAAGLGGGSTDAATALRLANATLEQPLSPPALHELVLRLGAFRADVSGAGPAVYGLFLHRRHADTAARALKREARTWVTLPVWYG